MTLSECWEAVQDAAGWLHARFAVERPEWRQADSPLKYVDGRAMEHTFAKAALLAREIAAGQVAHRSLYEIGPGTCYLLYVMRNVYGWDVGGCDIPDRPLYRAMADALGLGGAVADWAVRPGEPIAAIGGRYGVIVGTQVSWLNAHDDAELAALIEDLDGHLHIGGSLILFPNPQACGGRFGEYVGAHRPLPINLPLLGKGYML